MEYAEKLGKRIAHVHLHDSDGVRAHLKLGDGKVDFGTLMRGLAEIEEQRGDEITVVSENEGEGYQENWEKLKKLK